MYDLECVLHDPHGQQLLAAIATLAHERACQSLDDRAGRLPEALLLIPTGRVGEVGRVHALDGDVIDQRYVLDFDIVEGPFAEELDLGGPAHGDEFVVFFEDDVIAIGDVVDGFFDVGRHDCLGCFC